MSPERVAAMTDHLVKAYEEELQRLRSMVIEMGRLTGEQLVDIFDAAEQSDAGKAERVIEREPDADRLEHLIDNLVVRLLALRQPVAVDLRDILSALRIANELERICDHAEDIAMRLVALGVSALEPIRSLVNLGRFATTMVASAMRAYAEADAGQARAVWDRDRELDEMYSGLFRELLTYMIEDPRRITASSHMLFMARDIERIGDRATNIAEMVLYRVSGRPVEEERVKADATKTMTAPSPA
jgi:phosphate transport system protein